MGMGKILAGVAIGVGAIAAAPFTGGGSIVGAVGLASSLAGAGTVAAAIGAGAAGAVAGGVISKKDEENREFERRNAKKNGFDDGLKKGEDEILKKMKPILNDVKQQNDYMIGLTAFCYTVANCDGDISSEELNELDYFLNYISNNSTLSPAVISTMNSIKNSKLDFNECRIYLDKINFKYLNGFSEILKAIIEADDKIVKEELQIKNDWESYINERKISISSKRKSTTA